MHLVLSVLPAGEAAKAVQAVQSLSCAPPAVVLNLSATQSVQVADAEVEYLPAPQGTHRSVAAPAVARYLAATHACAATNVRECQYVYKSCLTRYICKFVYV